MQQRNLHLNSSLTFQDNLSFQETLLLSFSTGPHTNQNFSLTFLSFLLRKELGSSLEYFSQVHRFTHQKERKLSQALYLSYFWVQPLGKGNPFMQERFYSYFPLKNHKLGKGFSYSHLRIHDFFKEFLVIVFVVCKLRNHELVSLYIYIYICCFKKV